MQVIVSQQDKKIKVIFKKNKVMDNYIVDMADEFLICIDKFLKESDNQLIYISEAGLKFVNVSMLTERIIRAIIGGLRF